jgi:hypothetical protein
LSLPHLPHFFIFPPEQKMYGNTPPRWSLWNYLSNEPSYAWNGFRTRELCQFTPAMQSVQGWFQTAQRSMVLPYLIVRVFKIDDSWCVGNKVWRSF